MTFRLRSIRRSPALALAVAGMIACGIGITTATWSMVDAAILSPPPFADAGRLVILYTTHRSPAEGRYNARWSYPRVEWLRGQSRTLAVVADYSGPTSFTLAGDVSGYAEAVTGEVVSPEYFPTLGVSASVGRTFAGEGVGSGGQAVTVIGYDLWRRRFAGNLAIVGREVRINGTPLTVIGVMPPGFRGLTDEAQLWIPAALAPAVAFPEYLVADDDFISAVARLAPGVSLEGARAELDALGRRAYEAIPLPDADQDDPGATAVPLNEARVHPTVRRAVLLLLGGVALLHLLACANATSLLLGHAVAHRREAAVRLALGSSPRRLFLHYAAEAAAVVVAGGMFGIVLGFWLSTWIETPAAMWGPRNFYGSLAAFADPDYSWRSVVFGIVLTIVSAALVSVWPAFTAARVPVHSGLREGTRGTSNDGAPGRGPSARAMIVTLETALAIVLLVAGGMLIDSFNRMRSTPLGIASDRVLTFSIQPPEAAVPVASAPAFIQRMLDAIGAVPGVVSASVDGGAPLSGTARSSLYIVGRPWPSASGPPPVLRHYVAPSHFATLGIPLLRGRGFGAQDIAGRPRVAVISETAARTYWPNEDPLGQRVWFGSSSFDRPDSSAEIIGIVGDVLYEPLDVGPNRSSFYTPFAQFSYAGRLYFVRTTGAPSLAVAAIRDAVRSVEPDLALTDVRSLEDRIGSSWARQRFDAVFFGVIGVLALLLAVSGIFAVVMASVGRRRRDMGIRLALGSSPHSLVRLVVREGMMAPLAGVAIGVAASIAGSGVLRASLYGVSPADHRVLVITVAVLLLAASLACLAPALRATRGDPCETLRMD